MHTAEITEHARRAADAAVPQLDGARVRSAVAELDTAGLNAMADTIIANLPAGTTETQLAERLSVASRHRWLLRRWLTALTEHGCLIGSPDSGYRPGTLPRYRPNLHDICTDLGYSPALAQFFGRANQQSTALLQDRILVQELLFPDGDFLTAEAAYRDNTINRYLNAATRELVASFVDSRRHRRTPVRILELGAGIGSTTADVLPALAGLPVDYWFTDLSTFFLDAARRQFATSPWMRYDIVDLNTDLPAQPNSDIILAANVLHNAEHTGTTLRQLREALTPGGLLVFLESCREHDQLLTSMHFLMSPRAGQPHPGQHDVRAGSDRIFLSHNEWLRELAHAGLHPLPPIPGPDHRLAPLGQYVFGAYADD